MALEAKQQAWGIQGSIHKDAPDWENILQNFSIGGIYELGLSTG